MLFHFQIREKKEKVLGREFNRTFEIAFVSVFGTLKCWQCDSDKNPDCGDPFNATKIAPADYVECKSIKNLGPAYCLKTVVISRK